MSIVEIVEDTATIVTIVTQGPQGIQGPQGPQGVPGDGKAASTRFITSNSTQLVADTAIFSTGNNTLTMLNHLTATDPIDLKSDSGVLTINGTTDTVTILEGVSVRLHPTPTGWRYTG